MQTIGFIGLGHMGHPMVCNLLKANYTVKVFDVVEEAVARLAAQGALPCRSVAEIASNVDVIITMVQTGDQVRSLCEDSDGLFAHAKPGTLFIESSTIDVKTSRQLHRAAQLAGFRMIDAPVSGGVAGAEAAALTIMVGGSEADLNMAKPILSILGKKIIYAGGDGNGQVAKMCNNMILGATMIAVSEAFTLGEKLGLPAKTFFDIGASASSQCWAMTSYCPVPDILPNVPASNDYQPGFTAAMMLKDLKLSQDAARAIDASTPMGERAMVLYQAFVDAGNGQVDFSGIIKQLS